MFCLARFSPASVQPITFQTPDSRLVRRRWMRINKRIFATALLCATCMGLLPVAAAGNELQQVERSRERDQATGPNLIVIFCDDLGYGDLACFGHPTIQTPALDRMATEGMKLTQFYSAAPVCTPSRAALLTGRLPQRTGMCSNTRRVLFPDSKGGLQDHEVTIAEALHDLGYATGCIGKWHLGHLDPYLPTRHGFDSYFGIPYSNDMDRVAESPRGRAAFNEPRIEYWNVPLMRDTEIVERPADQTTITRRYTDEAVKFIRGHHDQRFFLYLAHSMPHVPLFASDEFLGQSRRGLFGDVIEEIDASVGRVLQTLRDLKIDDQTLVVFTSDNGPWLVFGDQGGSAGLLRGGKGSTWDGGMREPTIVWWPGSIPAGQVNPALGSTMDIFATIMALNGQSIPQDRVMDSFDLSATWLGKGEGQRDQLFYYRGYELMAVRQGPWKMHLQTRDGYGEGAREAVKQDPPMLFQIENDPGEQRNVAAQHPEVIKRINALIEVHQANYEPAPSQLER